jgi:hypothetical protein
MITLEIEPLSSDNSEASPACSPWAAIGRGGDASQDIPAPDSTRNGAFDPASYDGAGLRGLI